MSKAFPNILIPPLRLFRESKLTRCWLDLVFVTLSMTMTVSGPGIIETCGKCLMIKEIVILVYYVVWMVLRFTCTKWK